MHTEGGTDRQTQGMEKVVDIFRTKKKKGESAKRMEGEICL